MKKYWLTLALLVLVLIWWAFGRGDSAPTVHFATVRRSTIESTVSTNGKVEPAQWAAARAETAGVVKSIAVERGQQVAAGQDLVTLDTVSASSDLAAALAKEDEARANTTALNQGGKAATLANINDNITAARAALDVAQRNYDATARLAGQQAATKFQLQQAKDTVESARLHLASLENQKATLVTPADVSVAGAKLRDAEAALALARHRMRLAKTTAPIAGTLYQFDLKFCAYLQPGDQVGLIGDLDKVKVVVYVDEPDLGHVALDMPVSITWDAHPGQKWSGRVNKLPTEVIALGTRTVGEVTTVVDNPRHDLLPGVTVNALIVSKVVPDAISIPKAALRTIRGGTGAFTLSANNSLAWTPIVTGVSDVNNVQVVSGLQPGDKVADRVIEPSDAEVKDKMRVRPVLTD